MHATAPTSRAALGRRIALTRFVAATITAGVVLLGVWVAGGVISNDFHVSMALTTVWFAISAAAAALIAWRVRQIRIAVAVGYIATATVAGAYLGYSTLHQRTVSERVVTGVRAPEVSEQRSRPQRSRPQPARPSAIEIARGTFRSHEHSTRGRVAVVRLADGRQYVTLTRFETAAGPDLRVRLVAAGSVDGGSDGAIDLGALKGHRGDQQYRIPRGVDIRNRAVLIWCRAFSAPFGSARLAS